MTRDAIGALLASIDPDIRHYWTACQGHPYTYWEESARLPLMSDDGHEEGWRFYVHRFAEVEDDPIADALFRILDATPEITVRETVTPDMDTDLIHHIFECEAV